MTQDKMTVITAGARGLGEARAQDFSCCTSQPLKALAAGLIRLPSGEIR